MATSSDVSVEREVNVRGNRIQYLEKGEGETLCYLHGAGGLAKWRPFQEALSERFRVVAIEHPGFGESERPEWVSNMDDLSFFYLDILDALEIENTHLIGHSLGGWLAAEISARYPHRVRKLILLDAAGLWVEDAIMPDIFIMTDEETSGLMYYDPDSLPEGPEEDFVMQARAKAMTARLAWNPRFHDPKLPNRLHRISAPTLIVWGEADGIIPIEHGRKYQELIAGASLEVIEQSAHQPHVEQPEAFVRLVTDFIRD